MHRAVKIEFPFSESSSVSGVFHGETCWQQAQRVLSLSQRPSLGYYKTDFIITYDDGTTYSGRYDIGADAATLDQHVRDHLAYHGDPEGFLLEYALSY